MYYKILVKKEEQIIDELGEFESSWNRMLKAAWKIASEMRGVTVEIFRRKSQEHEFVSIQSMQIGK